MVCRARKLRGASAVTLDECGVEVVGHRFDRCRVRYVKHLVCRAWLVKTVATGEGDKGCASLADGLDTQIFGVAAKKDLLVGRVIGHSASHIDGSIDQVPFKLEQCWLVDVLDELLMQDSSGKVNLANRASGIVATVRGIWWQANLQLKASRP